jgi:hypothetical protein
MQKAIQKALTMTLTIESKSANNRNAFDIKGLTKAGVFIT